MSGHIAAIKVYAAAFYKHFRWVAGGECILFFGLGIYQGLGGVVSPHYYFVILCLGLVPVGYRTWRDEYEALIKAKIEVASKPQLSIYFDPRDARCNPNGSTGHGQTKPHYNYQVGIKNVRGKVARNLQLARVVADGLIHTAGFFGGGRTDGYFPVRSSPNQSQSHFDVGPVLDPNAPPSYWISILRVVWHEQAKRYVHSLLDTNERVEGEELSIELCLVSDYPCENVKLLFRKNEQGAFRPVLEEFPYLDLAQHLTPPSRWESLLERVRKKL